MKFLHLTLNNFLTIKQATVALADRGLNLIQGVNSQDSSASSNGAGKSSIVDGLSWVLYGVTARGVKGDAVVNRGAKKETSGIVTLLVGSTTYKVERYRKHSQGKNSLRLYALAADPADPSADLTRGTDAETQAALEKILGASHEVFVAAVYSGQEAMPDLPRMGDRDLKRLIEEAAGMQRIERAYALSRERMTTQQRNLTAVEGRLETTKVAMLRTEDGLTTRRQRADQWDADRAGVIAGMQERVERAKQVAVTEATNANTHKANADLAAVRLTAINVELGKHAELQRAVTAASRAEAAAERAIERHRLVQLKAKVDGLREQVANPAATLAKPCTECGTPGSMEKVYEWVQHKQAHLTTAQTELSELVKAVTLQVAAHRAATQATADAQAAVPDVTALEQERQQLQGAIDTFQTSLASARRAKTTFDQEKLTLDNQTAAVNPERAVVEDLEKRLAEEAATIAALTEQRDEAAKALAIAESVVKVFGPAGVRAQILDTVTPYLNARTADYLSVLSDGNLTATWTTLTRSASGDLKEKFSIEVTHAEGGDSFAAISGGEKRKVRLATALALQDLVASRASQPIELWVGDEIDDALDPAGLERLMTILERKARERGTVLVVSHSDLKDWCDQVTTVTKEAQFESVVEGALCS